MKNILVTGVSTGIGSAIAADLLGNGYTVIGTVRKEKDSENLTSSYPDRFHSLILDVTESSHIEQLREKVSAILGDEHLNALVNNSGIAIGGPLMHQDMEEIRRQFEVNFFGLLAVTREMLPLLGAGGGMRKDPGRIINISSTNGKITFPFIGAYSATKHALEAICDALRYELNIYGIKVVSIEPGMIKTPIWDKAEESDLSPYAGTDYYEILEDFKDEMIKMGRKGLEPQSVAVVVRKAIETNNPKPRYVISNKYLTDWFLPRILPDSVLDRMITKQVGLVRKKNN